MQNTNAAHPDDDAESMVGRRAAPRTSVRMPAKFVVNSIAAAVVVLDVSPTGARLQVPAPPPKGLFGHLHWKEFRQRCLVMWSHQQTFGVRFTEPLTGSLCAVEAARPSSIATVGTTRPVRPAQAPVAERRDAVRRRINFPCEVRQEDRWIKTYLANISSDGFEIIRFAGCREARPVYLRGERLPKLKGEVVWMNNLAIGCKLEARLHDAVLADVITRLWGP